MPYTETILYCLRSYVTDLPFRVYIRSGGISVIAYRPWFASLRLLCPRFSLRLAALICNGRTYTVTFRGLRTLLTYRTANNTHGLGRRFRRTRL